jgi:hypothetical protein
MWAPRTPAERETPLPLKFNLNPGRMLTRRLKRKPIINEPLAKQKPVGAEEIRVLTFREFILFNLSGSDGFARG